MLTKMISKILIELEGYCIFGGGKFYCGIFAILGGYTQLSCGYLRVSGHCNEGQNIFRQNHEKFNFAIYNCTDYYQLPTE